MKLIENCTNHFIDENGFVYSNYNGYFKKLKTFYDSKERYEMIVISENGIRKHYAIHKLVAMAYIENPCNYNEIHHIDNNPRNNKISNLEWCNHKYNLQQSYYTSSPTRNYVECSLYVNNKHIMDFKGIKPAAEYAAKHYNVSYSSMAKYLHSKNATILLKKV